jgi:arabinose-5-phosphate isomerase
MIQQHDLVAKHMPLIHSAINRSEHFSKAVQWYADTLKNNTEFQQNFLKLVHQITECSRSLSASNQVFFIAVGKSAQIANLS